MKYFAILSKRMCILPCLVAGSTLLAQSNPLASRLDSVASANLAADHAVGAVVLVVRGKDTLLNKGFGKADVEAGTPMPTDAIFGIGSITKQFTAAAILQLRDAKKVSLDDDITKWLPDFNTGGVAIPLRRLLAHTSGVADVTEMPNLRPFLRDGTLSRDSMYSIVRSYPLRFAPGAARIYSNPGYWLLHRVVEKASGISYEQYIQTRIFDALGMKSSGFCLSAPNYPRRATGYGVRTGTFRRAPLNTSTLYMGSGVLCSSASDMLVWLQALHGGKVLSASSYKEMITPASMGDGSVSRYGMGLDVATDSHGLRYIGHSGELTGYAARANWYPESKMAIVVLMNNSGDASPSAMASDMAAIVAPVVKRAAEPFKGDAASLAGVYKGMGRGGDMTITVTMVKGALHASVDGAAVQPLSWVDGLTFESLGDMVTFRRVGAGPVTGIAWDEISGHYALRRQP